METGTLENNKAILKKQFRNAFLVLCLIELINSASSITDSWFIGNYIGSLGMASAGYARPFFSFIDILCGPLGLGMQLVCSQYIGKAEIGRAQKVFSGAFTVGLIISGLLAVLGLTRTSFFTALCGRGSAAAEVIPPAEAYLKGLFLGAPAMVAFGVLAPIVQLGTGKKRITAGIILQLLADITGDALCIFVFDGGMFGIGVATAISYYFSLIPLLLYFRLENAILRLRLSFLPYSDIKDVFTSGLSKIIKRVCNTVKPILLNSLSLFLGTSLALSAYSVTNQVRDVMISFSAGAAGAVVLIGALLYSQRDRNGLSCLSRLAMNTIGLIAVPGVLCIIFSKSIAGFFISDSAEVLQMASLSIRCVGLMIPFSAFNGIYIAFLQITKRYKLVNLMSFLNRLILIICTSAALGLLFGVNGLWWALPLSEILNAGITLLIIRYLNGRFPRKAVDFLCLEPDFGYQPEDYIELSLNCANNVVMLQEKVKKFCEDHHIDSRRSYFSQLALEELSMNVIKHGFPMCRNVPVLHIWITYDKGKLLIRIQDNCPGFNVTKICSELQQMSPERCVGLRLVSRISQEMTYANILETNNLMIVI